jgi:signal transduction histidine kinase
MKRRSWGCCEALIALLLLVLAPWCGAQDGVTLRFTSADFLLSDSTDPPPDSAAWQSMDFPDVWAKVRPGVKGTIWYRLRWHLDKVPSRDQALYLPIFEQDDHAFLNGHRLTGSASPGLTRRTEPQYFDVDEALLRHGTNTVHLSMRNGSTLSVAPSVGDADVLRSVFARRHWLDVRGPHDLFGVALGLGVFMLMLWAQRRNEQGYGYFGLASLAYATWLLAAFDTTPLDAIAQPVAVIVAVQLLNICTFMFALRYGGWRLPRLELVLWASVPIGVILLKAQLAQVMLFGWQPLELFYWFAAAPAFVGYVFVFGRVASLRPSLESWLLTFASTGCTLSLLLYDEGLGLGPADLPHSLMAYSYLPLFLLIGWLLVVRFARSLNESERLNAELEQRVANKQRELQRNYEQLEHLTRQAAVVEERQRIMSDMHDGIGGQLISTLGLIEHGEASKDQVAAALRECIDDLRLAIDSLEPTDEDLLPVLGNLRYRLEGRLRQQGIALDWDVREVPKLACLTPQNVLHILRILQEAFTNILKHAHASRIRVSTAVHQGRVTIDISDNGLGFTGDRRLGGRGVDNMMARARAIGGELRVMPTGSGTTLSLLLPVGEAVLSAQRVI